MWYLGLDICTGSEYNNEAFQRQQGRVTPRKSCRGWQIVMIAYTVLVSFGMRTVSFLERLFSPGIGSYAANLTEVKTRMPNAKVLSEKQAIVASLTEKLQGAAEVSSSTTRASPSRRTLLFAPSAARTKSIMPSSRIRSFALLSTTSVSMSSMSSSTAPRLSPSRAIPSLPPA